MLLLPLRVALVAASTIPITIFISLGLLYCFNFELNTVTLAVLVLTLGMIVDNSIVIIDNYLEKIGEGMSRWHASIESTTHFFKSILSATLAISITFFPFLFTTTGMIHDFLLTFPWAITAVLGVSLLVATLLVPFLQFWFIRKPMQHRQKSFSVLDLLQRHYNRLIGFCFRWPKATVAAGLATAVAGIMLIGTLPQQMMPTADRNQFAVEIYLPSGAAFERTAKVADSLEHILRRDPRVVSVASFKGCSSPRLQNSYAPQIGGTNYAQFIVNTTGVDETIELLDEYTPRYHAAFPDALVRFKQLSYSEAVYPVEFRLSGNDWDSLRTDAGKLLAMMRAMPELTLAHSDNDEPLPTLNLSAGTTVAPGGDVEDTNEKIPPILAGLGIAAVVILFVLIAHFKKVGPSLLLFASMLLCLFGTSLGVIIQGVDLGVTCFLGIVALMGIIVRNGIIMFDYAEELRAKEHMHVRDAIYQSARRRMRPIFLTSAAASMGVIPMILGNSGLWMPMGTVICYGTLITMVLLLTVLPVAYYICFRGSTKRRAKALELESM